MIVFVGFFSPFKLYQIVSNCIKLYQIVSNCIKLYQIVSNCIKLHQINQTVSNCIKLWLNIFSDLYSVCSQFFKNNCILFNCKHLPSDCLKKKKSIRNESQTHIISMLPETKWNLGFC